MARRPPLDTSYMDVGRGRGKALAWALFALGGAAYFVVAGTLFWWALERFGPVKAGLLNLVSLPAGVALFRAGRNAARRAPQRRSSERL